MARGEQPQHEGTRDAGPPLERGALLALVSMALAPLVGAALGYVLLTTWVLDRFEIGYVQRVVEASRFLEGFVPSRPWVAFLGHSVMRDGVDGALVDDAAPRPLQSVNLAMGGFDLNDHRVVLPMLLERSPRVVVVGLSPTSGCYLGEIPPDKAYAYAYAGFVASWPPDRSEADFFGIHPDSYAALRSTAFEQRLHFRTVLVNAFDRHLRASLRSNLRSDYVRDFVHPYQYLGSVGPSILEGHLNDTRRSIENCARRKPGARLDPFFQVLDDIRASGAIPAVMVYPIHPGLQEAAEPFLTGVAPLVAEHLERSGGVWIDASRLLDTEHFADAVHPNAAGRARLSGFVGRRLPAG